MCYVHYVLPQVVVLEQSEDVGGVWIRNYQGFGLQVPWELYQFPEFPYPRKAELGEYPAGDAVGEYVRAYARHFELYRHILFSCRLPPSQPQAQAQDSRGITPVQQQRQQQQQAPGAAATAHPAPAPSSRLRRLLRPSWGHNPGTGGAHNAGELTGGGGGAGEGGLLKRSHTSTGPGTGPGTGTGACASPSTCRCTGNTGCPSSCACSSPSATSSAFRVDGRVGSCCGGQAASPASAQPRLSSEASGSGPTRGPGGKAGRQLPPKLPGLLEECPEGWDAVYEDSSTGRQYTLHVSFVVLCTGLYASPFIPTIPGQELYRGLQVHSRDFTDASVAAGKRVLVVGAGKTAADIVTELTATRTAAAVTLLYRRPHWPLPRFVGPVSLKLLAYTRLLSIALLPAYYDAGPGGRFAAALLTPLRKAFWVRFMGRVNSALGVKKTLGVPDRPICQDIWYSGQVVDAARWPEVIHNPKVHALQGEVDYFTPVSAVLRDGTELQTDIVLYATGYSAHYGFLEPEAREALEVQHDGLYLYRHVLAPGLPGLAFVGAEVSTFNNILTAALQAEWLAAALGGVLALPPRAAMAADVAAQQSWRRATMPPHKLRGSAVMLYMQCYHDQLLRDMGAPTHRKRPTWRHPLAECLQPYTAQDYADLFDTSAAAAAATAAAAMAAAAAGCGDAPRAGVVGPEAEAEAEEEPVVVAGRMSSALAPDDAAAAAMVLSNAAGWSSGAGAAVATATATVLATAGASGSAAATATATATGSSPSHRVSHTTTLAAAFSSHSPSPSNAHVHPESRLQADGRSPQPRPAPSPSPDPGGHGLAAAAAASADPAPARGLALRVPGADAAVCGLASRSSGAQPLTPVQESANAPRPASPIAAAGWVQDNLPAAASQPGPAAALPMSGLAGGDVVAAAATAAAADAAAAAAAEDFEAMGEEEGEPDEQDTLYSLDALPPALQAFRGRTRALPSAPAAAPSPPTVRSPLPAPAGRSDRRAYSHTASGYAAIPAGGQPGPGVRAGRKSGGDSLPGSGCSRGNSAVLEAWGSSVVAGGGPAGGSGAGGAGRRDAGGEAARALGRGSLPAASSATGGPMRSMHSAGSDGLVMGRADSGIEGAGSGGVCDGSSGGARRRGPVKRGFSLATLLLLKRRGVNTDAYDVSSSRIEQSSPAVAALAYKVLPPRHVEEALAAAATAAAGGTPSPAQRKPANAGPGVGVGGRAPRGAAQQVPPRLGPQNSPAAASAPPSTADTSLFSDDAMLPGLPGCTVGAPLTAAAAAADRPGAVAFRAAAPSISASSGISYTPSCSTVAPPQLVLAAADAASAAYDNRTSYDAGSETSYTRALRAAADALTAGAAGGRGAPGGGGRVGRGYGGADSFTSPARSDSSSTSSGVSYVPSCSTVAPPFAQQRYE
ncbi:hypothetical protein GPECTOR_53g109 [Gonium pectorale]|uniref:Flavin-containing monooxygenase n=1 Tax=Gonium pectorale TaxID=33097 RepID=A0A150G6X5_GONPE|nr:hypothetical protein GPECTOR_53g109 [Gonium pectorale]|eukprot:KXZ45523.1 hypothetical protein GPECTOR_53g109 [Gonium pectorale]